MKERGFRMYDHEVRAILAGTKTQTRRVVKDQPLPGEPTGFLHISCPYGEPGDRLWVRETGWEPGWERPERTARMLREGADTWAPYYYDADGLSEGEHEWFKEHGFKRRPSIHMPRWASRITLEITGVRVERLNEISEQDMECEGVEITAADSHAPTVNRGYKLRAKFRALWESINGPGSWSANPWVWVISFRRLP